MGKLARTGLLAGAIVLGAPAPSGADLAIIDPAPQVVVSYASDGKSDILVPDSLPGAGHGSYAAALAEALGDGAASVETMLREVRNGVLSATQGRQQPAAYASLGEELTLGALADGGAAHALAIGNIAYANLPELANAREDEILVGGALGRLGFRVTIATTSTARASWPWSGASPLACRTGRSPPSTSPATAIGKMA